MPNQNTLLNGMSLKLSSFAFEQAFEKVVISAYFKIKICFLHKLFKNGSMVQNYGLVGLKTDDIC